MQEGWGKYNGSLLKTGLAGRMERKAMSSVLDVHNKGGSVLAVADAK